MGYFSGGASSGCSAVPLKCSFSLQVNFNNIGIKSRVISYAQTLQNCKNYVGIQVILPHQRKLKNQCSNFVSA